MKHLYLLLILLSIAFINCSQNKENIKLENIIKVDLLSSNKPLYFSEFVDSITYIPLQTTDESIIGKIADIIHTDNEIFIFDKLTNKVLIFDLQGKYVSQIDREGNGPEEYVVIERIHYIDNKLVILDIGGQKLVEYDKNGNFIKKTAFKEGFKDFFPVAENGYLLSREGEIDKYGGILLGDSQLKIKKQLVKRDPKCLMEYYISDKTFFPTDKGIFFISPLIENTVYTYNEKGLERLYTFDVTPLPSKKEAVEKRFSVGQNFTRTTFTTLNDWIYMVFWSEWEDRIKIVLFDMVNHSVYIGNDFINDIDENTDYAIRNYSKGNNLYYTVPAETEDSNPILQILHLKEQ